MNAIRSLLLLGFLVVAGNAFGQYEPLRDPGQPNAVSQPVSSSPSTVRLSQLELHASELKPLNTHSAASGHEYHMDDLNAVGEPTIHDGHFQEWEVHPSHGDAHGEIVHECHSCKCGECKEHCHGVDTDPGRPRKPKFDKPGDRNRGDNPPYRYKLPDCKRAGNPHSVAKWAKCSVSDKYSAWFVGGGSAFCFGRCRTPSEGTWGLDYDGFFGHVNNWLTYTRKGRKQGGEGAYQTDGEPKIVSRAHDLIGLGH